MAPFQEEKMKVTLGDKLGAGLDKLRLQLPNKPEEPQPVVGVVVPDAVPRTPTKPDRVDLYYMGHTPGTPSIDEGQLIGEFIAWMDKKGMLPGEFANTAERRLRLQQWYFEECDQ